MIDWLRVHWRNGLRFQIAISILILGGIIALYLQFYNFANRDDAPVLGLTFDALEVESPVRDGLLRYQRTICNQSAGEIAGSVQRRLISALDDEREERLAGDTTVVLGPGECEHDAQRSFMLPDEVNEGRWVLRLILITTPQGGFISQQAATSQPFEVIPAPPDGE